ncbi:MAG: hypothetical protein HY721_31440 [Planctomycetes bacterium]|nr:hypothetical protein [Planctomycetota bacterium]
MDRRKSQLCSTGRTRRGERGTVLFLAVIVSVLILLATVGAVSTALSLGKEATYALDQTRALAVAEGVTEAAQRFVLEQVSNFKPVPSSGSVSLGGASYPYTVSPIGSSFRQTDSDGVTRSVQHYRISSSVNTGDGYATVDRVVDLTLTPLFQYMIFYQDDLEILPGPSMTLGGRVHANADIYVGCGNRLTVDSEYFRCTGSILRKRKNDGTESTGIVDIKVSGGGDYNEMDNAHDSELGTWTTYALDTWNGTVQDGAHGVKEIAAPDIQTIKAFNPDGTKGYYHANADLVIRDGAAFDRDGKAFALPAGTIAGRNMYDAREGKTVAVTEVNVGLLNASGRFPANGLIYAYRTDASATQPNGVRLTNGSEVLKPMTLVSEDPVYVRGDFNTVSKKGVAVISDAVNLLSNAWNDTKTAAGPLPAASNTSYNLAIVTGKVSTPDGGGNYSGGFENLPRFHENWTGKTAKIRGSFINIFDSEIAKSPWRYGGNVYTAPARDWQYDAGLNDLSNLPPFTPSAVYFLRVLWDDRLPVPFAADG